MVGGLDSRCIGRIYGADGAASFFYIFNILKYDNKTFVFRLLQEIICRLFGK